MTQQAADRRKKSLVDNEIQLGFARRIMLHWVVFFVVGSTAGIALQMLSDPFRPIQEQLKTVCYTNGPFLLALLFMLPVFVVDTIKFSHRLAGPIFRLRQTIREMANGESVAPLQTRKNDYWSTTVEDFNSLIEKVNQTANSSSEEASVDSDSHVASA